MIAYLNIAVSCLAEVMAYIEGNSTLAKSTSMVVNNRLRGGERNKMRW